VTVLFVAGQEERLLASSTQLKQNIFLLFAVLVQLKSVKASPFNLFIIVDFTIAFQDGFAVIL